MRLCHGSGNLTSDGCCYVNGAVCPLRWKIDAGHVYDAAGTDLGTVDAVIRQYAGPNPQRQRRVADQLQGVTFVCTAAVDVIANDPSLLTNRTAFEAAWSAHPRYATDVAPHWRALELANGWPAGSYDCPTWTGRAGPECCYAETQTVNDAKAQPLAATAVTIRRAGGRE